MPFIASVISAGDWGAVPPIEPAEETIPQYIVVHHTDSPNPPKAVSKGTVAGAKQFAKGIQNSHMNTNGWNDSGHNFLNTINGTLLEGRQGTLAAIAKGHCVRSAHARDKMGNESPGIENEGNFMTYKMTATQWNRLVELCASLCSTCHINPDNIKGHRDFSATDCPGDWLYVQLPRLRSSVREKLAPPGVPLKEGSRTPKVKDVQLYLKAWGFDPGIIDGVFGSKTKAALIAFEKSKGLSADGVVDAKTWQALIASPPPEPLPSGVLIDAGKSYQGSLKQDRALEWLQGQIAKPIVDEFAKRWRDRASAIETTQPLPLTLINVCKYYRRLSHQNQALEWLQEQLSEDILEQFAQKWES